MLVKPQSGHYNMTMSEPAEKIPASVFKAKCLGILDRVAENHQTVIVTKHGRPVAKVVPLDEGEKGKSLLGSVRFNDDIIAPIDEEWDAEK